MRLIFFILAFSCIVFGKDFDLNSLESDFTQTIISPEKTQILYKGHFFIRKDNLALWIYSHPVKKKIYFNKDKITIIEPELEQATVAKLQDIPNLAKILENAKQIDKDTLKGDFDGNLYTVKMQNSKPKKINYTDKFDNQITIILENAQTNVVFNDSFFEPNIPKNYDVILN